MEQASFVYVDLLDGKDKPVAGSTCVFTLLEKFVISLTFNY